MPTALQALRMKPEEGLRLSSGCRVPPEAAVSVDVSHPNLVSGFKYAVCSHPATKGACLAALLVLGHCWLPHSIQTLLAPMAKAHACRYTHTLEAIAMTDSTLAC